jgi:hypothetical protein
MADSMIMFVDSSKLPKVDELRNEVKLMGLDLEDWDENLIDIEGFWSGRIRDEETGFEFFIDKLDVEDLEDWDIDEKDLGGRNYVIELSIYSELDVEAAVSCTVALCKLSDAIAFNEDDELKVNANSCIQWAKEEMGYDLLQQS